jgi:LemA protein
VRETAAADGAMQSALSRLLVVVERYPDLKADRQFIALQSQLEGTENRITVARGRYNESVRAFNVIVKRIPGRFFAALFGFGPRDFFEVTEAEQAVPKVDFGTNK